jgi:hypothetical protein
VQLALLGLRVQLEQLEQQGKQVQTLFGTLLVPTAVELHMQLVML